MIRHKSVFIYCGTGRKARKEKEEDWKGQEENPVQQEVRHDRSDLRPQERTQCQFLIRILFSLINMYILILY